MAKFSSRDKRYSGKNYRVSRPSSSGKKNYRSYYHQQPSKIVYVEEPESDEEPAYSDETAESAEEYEFELHDTASEVTSDEEDDEMIYSDVYSDSDAEYGCVDLNDELENEAIELLELDGKAVDMNNELLRFYDDESSNEDIPVDDCDFIIMDDSTTEEIDESDLEKHELENLRNQFIEVLDESDSDTESSSEAEFIEIDPEIYSEYDTSDSEDIGSEPNEIILYDNLSESSSSDESDVYLCDSSDDSSDDEGITIYKKALELPEESSSDEEDEENLLQAYDSDDEIEVIDLSDDLEHSKDCELVELDENTYKLNLRFPSIIKDELKIDFVKNKNMLKITGKFNLNKNDYTSSEDDFSDSSVDSDSDSECDSNCGSSSDSSENSSSSSSSSSDSEETQSSESEDEFTSSSESSDEEEEILEDAEDLKHQFEAEGIMFEKTFEFEKAIKFDQIVARFIDDELELIIPNYGNENVVKIPISGVEDCSDFNDAISE